MFHIKFIFLPKNLDICISFGWMVLDLEVRSETELNLWMSFHLPCSYVFLYERAYQVADTATESSVITKVKGFGRLNNAVMDVADYIYPPQVWNTQLHN